MPRTLPWLVGDAPKKKRGAPASPLPSRARSSSASDLVNSDLDIISGYISPKAKARRAYDRSPSTSPPPEAPKIDVEFMREGLNADDAFIMVEDEFDATARLFTQHIHRAEYARLKRLHRSRGVDTLAKLDHGTDTTTQQSRAVKIQIEAEENARKRKSAGTDGSEDEDEYLDDPMLARLMTADRKSNPTSLLAGLGKAKGSSRAAKGYSQSPRKIVRTRDVLAASQRSGPSRISSIAEDEDTDDEDLDAGTAKSALSSAYRDVDPASNRPRSSIESSAPDTSHGVGFFKAFNHKSREERASGGRRAEQDTDSSSTREQVDTDTKSLSTPAVKDNRATYKKTSSLAEILARRRGTTQQPEPRPAVSKDDEVRTKKEPTSPVPSRSSTVTTSTAKSFTSQASRAGDILARRRNDPVKIKEEKPRTKARPDDIPTFLF